MTHIKKFLEEYLIYIICFLLLFVPDFTSQYVFYVFERGVQNSILVLGLVILIGYSGMMTLGSAALLAIGGYAYGIILINLGLHPVVGALLAILVTMVFGTLLAFPAFKLSGPFLVVTTVGFGEIIRILLLNLQSVTGGAYGLANYPVVGTDSQRYLYYGMIVVMLLVTIGIKRLGRSRIGLALKALRQDQVAAEVMGVDVRRAKIVTYALFSMLAGVSGVFIANLTGYLSPDSFTSAESTTYLLMVVMGGLDSAIGAVLSSIGLTSLPEMLRFLSESRLMIYSLVLFVFIRVKWGGGKRIFAKKDDRKKSNA